MASNSTLFKALCVILCSGLTLMLKAQTAEEWKTRLLSNRGSLGISSEDAAEATISSSYRDASTGIEYAYLQQNYQQLRVFNNIITLAYRDGKLLHHSGSFLSGIRASAPDATPVVQPGSAVVSTARHLRLAAPVVMQPKINRFQAERKLVFDKARLAKRDIETELLWVEDEQGQVHLAWNVNIDIAGSPDWWNVRIDARTGEVVNKDNWTVHEHIDPAAESEQHQWVRPHTVSTFPFLDLASASSTLWAPPTVENATYLVVPFPYESQNFGPVTIDNNPWLKAGAGNPAVTYGWHFDGTNNYTVTRGNNVDAYEDSASKNTPGRYGQSSTGIPSVTFQSMPNFTKPPFDSTNRNFALTNLFYWNNIVHDVTYQYGFDENAGNFQVNNIGRGGSGNDPVKAEAQDGSGNDNANFSTPSDGSSGRMQMFLWAAPSVFTVTAPASIAGRYDSKESGFSTANKFAQTGPVTGQVVFYDDAVGNTHLGCDSNQLPQNPVTGKIVLMYRGGTDCAFATKFRAAQKAGAIAVIMVNNVSGYPITMGGTDNGIVIPGLMISDVDGARIAAQIPNGVTITMGTTGLQVDGDLDNGVIAHEYGHGVSNRLTGGRVNASCLGNVEQGGEGWSDYLSLMITTDWSAAQLTDGPKRRPVGTYAVAQPSAGPGLRRFPYSTNLSIDTLTYANVATNTEVHAIGEVWCSALWDMTWNVIQHEGTIAKNIYSAGSGAGNTIALRLVMEGMKLQPCRPGFLDARNAILAADSILYNYRHKCDIWNAFARRGMGVSALQGSSNSATDQVPAFDVPSGIILKRSALPALVSAGQQTTIGLTAACQCQVPTNGFSITDTIPAGFSYVNSNQGGMLAGNVVRFNTVRFTTPLDSTRFTVTLTAGNQACALASPVSDDRDTDSTGNLVAARVNGNTTFITSSTRAFNGSRAWYAADSSRTSNFTLTSAPFVAGSLSVLSFWHYFVTENTLDGGKVEISADNGSTWVDAGPFFLQNGYNTQLSSLAGIQPNTPAFSGTSYATSSLNGGDFIQSIVNLSRFSGQTIQIRFRFQTNASNASNQQYDGWYIDDITVNTGCGAINQFKLNSSSGVADSLSVPVFVVPQQTTGSQSAITFTARQAGGEVALSWQTVAEANTRSFVIERSADGVTWATIGTVAARGTGSSAYSFTDPVPLDLNLYRIRVTDKNAQSAYTVIRTVKFLQSGIASVSPNPAADQAMIYFAGSVVKGELLLTDLTGRVLQKHALADNLVSFKLVTGGLPSGTYIIKVQMQSGTDTRKILVRH